MNCYSIRNEFELNEWMNELKKKNCYYFWVRIILKKLKNFNNIKN